MAKQTTKQADPRRGGLGQGDPNPIPPSGPAPTEGVPSGPLTKITHPEGAFPSGPRGLASKQASLMQPGPLSYRETPASPTACGGCGCLCGEGGCSCSCCCSSGER